MTISDRNGAFPGMLKKRTFNVAVVSPANNGADLYSPAVKKVKYSGTGKSVKMQCPVNLEHIIS